MPVSRSRRSDAPRSAGIALVNSLGTVGGAIGPFMIGFAQARTGSPGVGLACAGVILLVSALAVLPLSRSLWRLRAGPVQGQAIPTDTLSKRLQR